MHVLQYIAVKAENADEALSTVDSTLNSELGSSEYASSAWFDWFVPGGGRFMDGDPYKSSPNNIISYADDREGFSKALERMLSNRVVEFNEYRKRFGEKDIDISAKLDSYDGNTDYSFDLYDLHMMIEMLQGTWNYNSYFYDMHNASTNTKFMLDTLGDSWYLVPVDFHF